jgi:hypothetical protein
VKAKFNLVNRAQQNILQLSFGVSWLILLVIFCPDVVSWGWQSLGQMVFILGSVCVLYMLPGLAVVHWLWRDDSIPPLTTLERFIFALAIGVALPPLLIELAYLVHFPWNNLTTLAWVSLSLVLWLALHRSLFQIKLLRSRSPLNSALPRHLSWQTFLLMGMFITALWVRLYMVRDLPVGLWGDSYQHTLMAQLLVDNQGLFTSWEPYAPLTTFTYHFGFHANVAFFHWLTHVPVTQSVLYVGQLLNAATLLLAYWLTTRILKLNAVTVDSIAWAGVFAALLTSFVNTQPVYFVNWGRYTQLAGQVLLPVVLLSWMAVLESEHWSWRRITLATIMSACLALTHYIVTIFAVLFLLTYAVALLLHEPRWPTVQRVMSRASVGTVLALALVTPWIWNTLSGGLVHNTTAMVSGQVSAERIASYASLPPLSPFYLKSFILMLSVAGLLLALGQRKWRTALLAVWGLCLILVVVPYVVGLPGAGVVDFFAAYIALYVPLIPLAAYALGAAQDGLARWRALWTQLATTTIILAVSVWGMLWQQHLIDAKYQLVTPADMRAMEWIRIATPREARFWVNAFPAYGSTLVAGSDAGWWLPLLTSRQSNLPPLTYGSERWTQSTYYAQVNGLVATLRERPLTDATPVRVNLTTPHALEALRRAGITHVYSGANVATGGAPVDRIDTSLLRVHPAFRLVYEQAGVEIFQFMGGN